MLLQLFGDIFMNWVPLDGETYVDSLKSTRQSPPEGHHQHHWGSYRQTSAHVLGTLQFQLTDILVSFDIVSSWGCQLEIPWIFWVGSLMKATSGCSTTSLFLLLFQWPVVWTESPWAHCCHCLHVRLWGGGTQEDGPQAHLLVPLHRWHIHD